MKRTAAIATIVVFSTTVWAQTPPAASQQTVSVTGCVAPVQRDGSTGPKPTGTTATPESAPMEANNPEPTGKFMLLEAIDAQSEAAAMDAAMKNRTAAKEADPGVAATGGSAAAKPTSYALRGQEQELAKHVGHRVQINGTLMPPLKETLPSKSAKTAEGIQAVQVTSVKMLGTNCSATGPK